jgi:succinate-semialdehyde dehydrogenase/glutarate-semialdehyde dehydrogenase
MTIAVKKSLASMNPATGETIGEVPVASSEDVLGIVARSRAAQPVWGDLTAAGRVDRLRPAADALRARAEELGRLITLEMGKPLREGIGEVKGCARSLPEDLEAMAAALEPEIVEDERTRSTVYRDPFGVCAAISPWNFPLAMPHQLVIPALAAGNTVVLKPSEETPLTGQAYADLLNEFLPEGVLLTVHGADDQGRELVAADVDLIAFTGSRETGKKILGNAAAGLKRVILELGGKDPMIVLDDADLEKAAEFAAMNSFRNAGQVCVSTERIYVDEKVAGKFEALMARIAADYTLGDGLDEGTKVGPMVNATQRDHVIRQLDTAVRQGARVVTGGANHPERFVRPTVLSDLVRDMEIMREETFGPVACIVPFSKEGDAVAMANDTPFGLGAVVFGEESHALGLARRLQSGMIGVNKSCGGASGTPWVGAKQSGYGFHSSRDGHRQFAQARVVSVSK